MQRPAIVSLLSLATVLALLPAASAQNPPAHPDLSGTWILDVAKSRVPKTVSLVAQTVVISCSDKTVEFRFAIKGQDSIETYTTDGKDHSYRSQQGEFDSRAQWKQSVLVTKFSFSAYENRAPKYVVRAGTLRNASPGREFPNGQNDANYAEQRWSLSQDGRVLSRVWVNYGFSELVYVYNKR